MDIIGFGIKTHMIYGIQYQNSHDIMKLVLFNTNRYLPAQFRPVHVRFETNDWSNGFVFENPINNSFTIFSSFKIPMRVLILLGYTQMFVMNSPMKHENMVFYSYKIVAV